MAYADAWIEDMDFKDPDTGQMMNRELLNQELTKIEKPAGIANPKDFRNEVVKFALRARAKNGGKNPSWTSYEKIREVIERRMFSQVEDLLPVISFGSKKDGETEKKHTEFVVAHDGARLHRTPGAAAGGVVHAGEAGRLSGPEPFRERRECRSSTDASTRAARSLPNRQRFLRRAKALVQDAVRDASAKRGIRSADEGGEVGDPAARHPRADLPPRRRRHPRPCAAGQQGVPRRRRDPASAGRRRRRRLRGQPGRQRARTSSASF